MGVDNLSTPTRAGGWQILLSADIPFSKYRHGLKPIAKTGSWAQPANGGAVTDPRVKVPIISVKKIVTLSMSEVVPSGNIPQPAVDFVQILSDIILS